MADSGLQVTFHFFLLVLHGPKDELKVELIGSFIILQISYLGVLPV